jgi:soluble lytic murein transglycosylase-like protein
MKTQYAVIGVLLMMCVPVHAQIYSGMSLGGSVILSTSMETQTPDLLVEAPPEELPLALAEPVVPSAAVASIPAPYLPYIQEASRMYKLPGALIHAVIAVESNYNPLAKSPKGAHGLMQLMPATAKRFGLTNQWDPRQNILTGSRYLRWLMDYFNQDLQLSLAAYNAGEGAVMRAGRRIPPFAETENYVPKVLSIYQKFLRLI